MNIELAFRLVVLGMFLIFSGVAWGMWDHHKQHLEMKEILNKILEDECTCDEEKNE